ncbi:MAG: preprotein translocase subunit SecY [Planctomycetota bacterium]|jgi:preprotein translocase subunit SecY
MNAGMFNVFRIPELRKKIFFTLGLLVIYRIGFHIPLPGVEYEKLQSIEEFHAEGGMEMIFGLMSTLSGGALGTFFIFTLGVMPYISSSIIMSLLVKVIPALEKLSKEGAQGQKIINKYTRWGTVPLCLIQGMFIIQGYLKSLVDQWGIINPDMFYTFWYQLLALTVFTTGTLFIMWLGEQISEHGIGNGVSLIIMGGILARMPSQFELLFNSVDPEDRIGTIATLIGLYIGIVMGIVFITKGQRRIPVQQAKLTRGRKVYGGQRHYLPLKVNQAGVMPIIFASALFILPPFLGKMFNTQYFDRLFEWGSFWYILSYVVMIFFFSFFWTSLMFQPTEIANNLKENGGFVPGLRPGKRTADYLESVMYRVTLAGATFLAVIAIIPQIISSQLKNIPSYIAIFLGGTSILIVVGVILDLVDKLNSQLLMRNYEGFVAGGASSAWARGRKR